MRAAKAKQLRRLGDQAAKAGLTPPAKVRRYGAWLAGLLWRQQVQAGQVRLVRVNAGPPLPWRGAVGQSARRPAGYQAGPSEKARKRAARRERALHKEVAAA